MPYGDKESYSFFKMKYQGNNSAFPFKESGDDVLKKRFGTGWEKARDAGWTVVGGKVTAPKSKK